MDATAFQCAGLGCVKVNQCAHSKQESETERQNRLLREENAALRRVLAGSIA